MRNVLNDSEFHKKIKQNYNFILFSITIFTLNNLRSILISYVMGSMIDILHDGNVDLALEYVLFICLFCFLAFIINFVFKYFQTFKFHRLHQDLKLVLIRRLFYYENYLISSRKQSKFINEINVDCSTITNHYIVNLPKVITDYFIVIVLVILLFWINPLMCLIIFICVFFQYSIYLLVNKKLYMVNKLNLSVGSDQFSLENTWINKLKFVKIQNIYNKMFSSFENQFSNVLLAAKKVGFQESKFEFFRSIAATGSMVIIFVFSIFQISKGNLTVGSFLIVYNCYQTLDSSIQNIFQFGATIQLKKASDDRISEVLSLKNMKLGNNKIERIDGIKFVNINFSYPQSNQILVNFCYQFDVNNLYLLKGKNGSGKSTLMNLLLGLFEPKSGKIEINEWDLKDLDIYYLRKNIFSVLSQDIETIPGNIFENLGEASEDIRDNYLYDLDRIDYNNKIEDLSNGEKRKIMINKVLSKKASVILLDEPESFLDNNSICQLKDYLAVLKKDKIIIIISHTDKFDTIADDILHMDA